MPDIKASDDELQSTIEPMPIPMPKVEDTRVRLEDGTVVDGFIEKISFGGKTYALKCRVIEAHPITCPKCGGSFELAFGKGRCQFCGTYFTTEFKIKEESAVK